MDEVRFKDLFTEVERWVLQAREHHYVSQVLTEPTHSAFSRFVAQSIASPVRGPDFMNMVSQSAALSNARALYFGLTLELAAKARSILDGKVSVDSGVAKGLRTDHDVIEHVRQCGVQLNESEFEFLELLSYQLASLSKYPVAKNLKAQNRFTGRKVGAAPAEQQLVYALACRVNRPGFRGDRVAVEPVHRDGPWKRASPACSAAHGRR